MNKIELGFFVALLTVAAANIAISAETKIPSKILDAANRYVKEKYPYFDTKRYPQQVADLGNAWEVSFVLPNDSKGGSPVVDIDKSTLQLLKIFHTQ
jgi:hypothetical protein